MTTLSTLRTGVRTLLYEPTPVLYDSTWLDGQINRAAKEVALMILRYRPVELSDVEYADLDTAGSYVEYKDGIKVSLPPNLFQVKSLKHYPANSETPSKIAMVSDREYQKAERDGTSMGRTRTHYCAMVVSDSVIPLTTDPQLRLHIFPDPKGGEIHIDYYWLPTDMVADTDLTQLSPVYDNLIEHLAALSACIIDGNSARQQSLLLNIQYMQRNLFRLGGGYASV